MIFITPFLTSIEIVERHTVLMSRSFIIHHRTRQYDDKYFQTVNVLFTHTQVLHFKPSMCIYCFCQKYVLEFPLSEHGKRFGQSFFMKFLGQEKPDPCPTPTPRHGTFGCHINLTGAFISGAPSHQRCSSCVLIHCFKWFPSLCLQVKLFH